MLNVTSGIVARPVKCCVYGVEGIGKSTFASQFPDPLFFDLDGGTSRLDVKRVTDIQSWPQLMQSIEEVWKNLGTCRTLVIDTADAAERLCIGYLCGKHGKKGIEDFSYGSGYAYLVEEFARVPAVAGNLRNAGCQCGDPRPCHPENHHLTGGNGTV